MFQVAQIQGKRGVRQLEILTGTLRTANTACGETSSVTFEEKLLFHDRNPFRQVLSL